jgi:endonuclease-3 related protein
LVLRFKLKCERRSEIRATKSVKLALGPVWIAGLAGILDLAWSGRYRAEEMPALGVSRQSGSLATPPAALAELVPQSILPTARSSAQNSRTTLHTYYDALSAAYGPQGWWPGRTRFEVIVGTILVQNTSWRNAALAISELRRARLLAPAAIERVSFALLARLLRSSGYFRQKAGKLKAFVRFLGEAYQGSLTRMFRAPTAVLREQLLGVNGIGPETADAILLYAGEHPVFVVDAYARRMLERHGLTNGGAGYEELRQLFENALPRDPALYNEFHALIVHAGKNFCRARNPRCSECALKALLPIAESSEL